MKQINYNTENLENFTVSKSNRKIKDKVKLKKFTKIME